MASARARAWAIRMQKVSATGMPSARGMASARAWAFARGFA